MNARQTLLFHKTFAATGSVCAAARAAEISTAQARRLRQNATPDGPDAPDPVQAAVAALESEAVRRALEGVAVPVFHQGRECGSTVKHSDTLLMFLLKTLNPTRYGATQTGTAAGAASPQREPVLLDLDLSAAETDEDEGLGDEARLDTEGGPDTASVVSEP